MRKVGALLSLFLIGVVAGAVYHFTIKGDVEVSKADLELSQQSFTAELKTGTTYIKEIEITNYGSGKEVYFEFVVEGPDPEAVDVEVHDIYGNKINSGNKLLIPAGTQDSPTNVTINVHVTADKNAEAGEYTVYIMAKET
ncbi:conserved hypothetical protein [Ferroglobus placidus DSM 10642]|uniref:CARDB domain-containing protein n=1 Tax=Ferroglobus placidus (strain DSM 10642 / AEDII12DO) TaxID=589924 RepID=D3RXM8_FERPA|nr:hypothetical protein [Ferroglobus placidus]ADC65241.1 conserved hypothetical protein [Ferroglobus placidus DSM 10642]